MEMQTFIKLEIGKTYLRRDNTKYRVDYIPELSFEHDSKARFVVGTWWNAKGQSFRVDVHESGRVWWKTPSCNHDLDIVSEYEEPKEIWVNIYDDGMFAHPTEHLAKQNVIKGLSVKTRHFREVVE